MIKTASDYIQSVIQIHKHIMAGIPSKKGVKYLDMKINSNNINNNKRKFLKKNNNYHKHIQITL